MADNEHVIATHTPEDHYLEAEKFLRRASEFGCEKPLSWWFIAQAHVHAVLATARDTFDEILYHEVDLGDQDESGEPDAEADPHMESDFAQPIRSHQ